MIKFYEMAPEYRESPIDGSDFLEGCAYGEVTITGNRNFDSYKSCFYETAEMMHDDICNYDLTVEEISYEYKIVDMDQLKKAYDATDMRVIMCRLMGALTGREWCQRELRGAVQSEWVVMYYPADMWNVKQLQWFETAYWNMGSEWVIEEEDGGGSLYTCEWDEAKVKADLAERWGVDIENCEFYKFDGYVRQPKYKLI